MHPKENTVTLREQAKESMQSEVTAAARKSHERNYEKLHIRRDGTVSWFESLNKSEDLIDREANGFKAVRSVITVGTGSVLCNCDFCEDDGFVDRAEAIDAAITEHGTYQIEHDMEAAFEEIPQGYFHDEEAE